jgi:RNA polymerase sigma factor (TIGR02999 family)
MLLTRQLQQTQARVSRLIDSVCGRWLSSPANRSDIDVSTGAAMTPPESRQITALLRDWRNGDEQALERLIPLVNDELRRLAARYLRRERPDHTLQPTALVNEAWLQLIGQQQDWQSRAHFMGVAARLMRRILVDHARTHAAMKRGQGAAALPLDEALAVPGSTAPDVIALDDALHDLAKLDERKSRIIELRYFGGLSMEEMAEVMSLSVATLRREMRLAEAWLGRQMQKP